MDLLIEPTPENSRRVYNALLGLNVTVENPDSFAKPDKQAQVKQRQYYADILTRRCR